MNYVGGWTLFLLALAACDPGPTEMGEDGEEEDSNFPSLHGSYEGEILIGARVGAGARLGAYCVGPATITIISTDEGHVVGKWDLGPTYHFESRPHEIYYPACSQGRVFSGTLGGNASQDSLVLSFYYGGTDMISGLMGWEYVGGGPRNEWAAQHEDGGVVLDYEYGVLYPRFSHPDSTRFSPWVIRFPFGPFPTSGDAARGGLKPVSEYSSSRPRRVTGDSSIVQTPGSRTRTPRNSGRG